MISSTPDRALVLALDIATRTGWAMGPGRDGRPCAGSVRFANQSNDNNIIFGAALRWFSDFLYDPPLPDILVLESLLPPDAMKNHTSRQVRDRLAGLHGIMRAVATDRGIKDIREVAVGDVRAHFIGTRKAKRDLAKQETMQRCAQLGWKYFDDNGADALAIWSYTRALIDPAWAIKTVPLFNKALRLQP